jgi:hypothetical protein
VPWRASSTQEDERLRNLSAGRAACPPVFHGWWMVAACVVVGAVGNALGLFGASVYLHQVVLALGWSTALVSAAVSLS